MPTISPDIGYLGDRLQISVSGVRTDLGPRPSVYFSLIAPPPSLAEVTVTPGSVRHTGPGRYEFEIQIALSARGRSYTVVLTRQPGWSDVAGNFTVRAAYRLTGGVPNWHHVRLALPAPAPATPPPAGPATPAAPSAPVLPSDPLRRILAAEADILTAMAGAAREGAHCPRWLKAAAKKECCAAKVLEAVAALSKMPPMPPGA